MQKAGGFNLRPFTVKTYFLLAPIPMDVSFGLTALASGPTRPAMKALARVFGSVIPDIYRAATADAAARR